MKHKEVMQQALEALERYSGVDQRACDAEDALRTALEQPEQQAEPVAWMSDMGSTASMEEKKMGYVLESAFTIPLYTTPPAAQQRKPLTDYKIWQMVNDCMIGGDLHADKFARAIEAAHGIKERT